MFIYSEVKIMIKYSKPIKKRRKRLNYKRIIMVAFIITIILFLSTRVASNKSVTDDRIIVQKDDTLWEIARRYKAPNEDIRSYIYKLQKLNNVKNIIYPGDVLTLP